MDFDHVILCTDRNGVQNPFRYSLEESEEDGNLKWVFRIKPDDLKANDWFEFCITRVNENVSKITVMNNRKMIQYIAKGIPERMIEEASIVLKVNIFSSSNNSQSKSFDNEWRSSAADKVWQRLVHRGLANYNQETDTYSYIYNNWQTNLKVGVIIIGSLIWENTPIRKNWRKVAFKNPLNPILVPVKIRYGRQSSKRQDTFTMILSNHESTIPGQALILEFENEIKNFRILLSQAYALAQAEGICQDLSKPTLNANWGTVGLLLNPDIDKKDPDNATLIRRLWTEIYNSYSETFNPESYKIEEGETNIIDQNGFLNIDWTNEMNEFDILLATPTQPRPRSLPTPKIIADKIKKTGYDEYFKKNRENKIMTFQDEEILNFLSNG